MENNNYENYEIEAIEEAEVIDIDDYTVEECGNDKGKLALVIGGLTLVGAGAALAIKKIKEKKAGKPKVKRRLRWVEVEDTKADVEAEEAVEEVEEVKEATK